MCVSEIKSRAFEKSKSESSDAAPGCTCPAERNVPRSLALQPERVRTESVGEGGLCLKIVAPLEDTMASLTLLCLVGRRRRPLAPAE